jgi:hypothetical protein
VNVYVWVALGAALGWFVTTTIADKAFMSKVETIGCGMFGAVIGAQVQITMSGAALSPDFQPAMLIGALGGGIGMLAVLGVFRKAIGPMKPGRKKRSAR